MALLLAAVIGLIALIVTPGYLFYFDVTPKIVILLAGTALALICSRPARFRGANRGFLLLSLLLLASALWLGLSTLLSTNPALSAFGTNWRRFGAAIQVTILVFAWLVARHTAARPDRVKVILRAVAISGAITALYGIAQYFGYDPLLPASAYHIGEGVWTIVRPPGTLGYVSYFATWLLFVNFSSLALATMEPGAWRRFAYVSAGLAVLAMLLTGTRAAVAGLLAGVAVWLVRRGTRVTARMVAIAVVVVIASAAFYFSPAGANLRSRTRWFVEDPWGGARPTLWRDSLRMAAHRLPYGYGPEVFTAAFPAFESKSLAQAYPDYEYESPHNIFLDALVSQGLPGLVLLCALCVLAFRMVRRGASAWLAAALAAGMVAQFFTVFTVPTACIFYLTIALIVGLASEVQPVPAFRRTVAFRVAMTPAALVLLYVAARLTIADRALELTRKNVDSGRLEAAAADYNQYDRWRLPGTTADLWYSRALLNLAVKSSDQGARFRTIAHSGSAAVRATQTAEDPFNAWYNMATLYASQNDSRRTESSLRSAIAASPNWFKPHWALAQVLRLEGRMEDAEQEAQFAADLNAGKNPEVMSTLAEIRAQKAALHSAILHP